MNKYMAFLLMTLPSAANAARAVMEGIPASNNTIFVSTPNARIGLSTGSPSYTLDVNGTALVRGQEIITSTLTVQGNAFSVGTATLAVINGNLGIGTTSPIFSPNDSVFVAIEGSGAKYGELGMGRSQDAVNGDLASFAFYNTILGGTEKRNAIIVGSNDGATNKGRIGFNTAINGNLSEKMRITNDGSVGIGTTAPDQMLTVQSASSWGTVGISRATNGTIVGVLSFDNKGSASGEKREAGVASFTDGESNSGNLQFYTTNLGSFAERIRITKTGDMGVGALPPAYKLDVNGAENINGQLIVAGTVTFQAASFGINQANPLVGLGTLSAGRMLDIRSATGGTNKNFIRLSRGDAAPNPYGALEWTDANSVVRWQIESGLVNANFHIATGDNSVADATKFTILSGGNVGIGQTNPGSLLDVNGTIRQATVLSCSTGLTTNASGDINGCAASDAKLKKSITPLKYKSNSIDKLKPIVYEWNHLEDRKNSPPAHDYKKHIGFVAQDVEKVYPEVIVSAGKNVKGIDTNALIAVLVQEIQNLRKRVSMLEKH